MISQSRGVAFVRSQRSLQISRFKRCYHELSFETHGDPREVLKYRSTENDEPIHSRETVLVAMKSCPWNPADRNTVEGKYPSPYRKRDEARDSLHQSGFFKGMKVVGSEGWGRVAESDGQSPLKPGDWVTVGQPGLGTMRSSLWVPAKSLIHIRRGDELSKIEGASSLFQLGGTAYRMLHDFVELEDGDMVIQNAGNSGVGIMVSQLVATLFPKVQMVSFVRRGSRSDESMIEMIDYLRSTARNHIVFMEDHMNDREVIASVQSELSMLSKRPPKLALNAVGGDSATTLLKLLGPGGKMVTYGGMSMKPVTVATPQLIFKDLSVEGYWHSAWMVRSIRKDRERMVNRLVDLALESKLLCAPSANFPLKEFQTAFDFEDAQSDQAIRKKIIFDIDT